MDKNPFGIFENEDDYVSWDKYYQQLDLIDLSEANRERARKSISFLRHLLGEDFLRIARRDGNSILFWFFTNAAPRARLSLIWFTEALESLEGADKFDDLVKRIKDARRVEEALTVLDTAYKFQVGGFVVAFDPVVMVANKDGIKQPKMPDLKLTNEETGEEIFVEVSRLRTSARQNKNDRTYHVIWNVVHNAMHSDPEAWQDLLNPKHVLPYARIGRALEEQELCEIVGKIEKLIEEVRRTKEYREFSIENTIEVAASPSHDHSRVKEWAASRNMRDLVQGPLIPFNEINRAKGKIFDELHQLPDDRPGIVVIPATGNLLFFVYYIKEIILKLADEVSRHPKLLCAVVSHCFTGSADDGQVAVALGQHTVISKTKEDLSTEQAVIIFNETCALPITPSTATKVRHAFTNG